MEERELPVGWERCLLGDAVDYGRTQKAEPSDIPDHAWVLELEDIEKDSSKLLSRSTYAERKSKSTKNAFDKGAVLYGKLRPYLNKVLLADEPGFCSTEIIPLLAGEGIAAGYLFHWLKSPEFLEYTNEVSHGINMPRLGTEAGRKAPLVLAPLNEQRRIAAKLDATLAAVDACRQRLDGVAAILKRFRQAVLAAATSGELTREWREERGLANSWKAKALSEIADSRLGKMLDQSKNTGRLTPYLRNINVRWFSFDLDDIQEMRLEDAEIIDLDVRFGDLLVCEGGEPGRCAVWRGEDSKYTFQKALHRVRTSKHLLADYLSFCLSNSANNGKLEQLFTGTTIKHLTGASLKKFQIPLPSREEQEEIVDRVKSLFSLADQLEARLNAARKIVDRLTPALLAKAFRGELVPQDPTDEPASVLLKRLAATRRAARQAEASAGKSSRRGRPKAAANPDQLPLDAAPVPPDFLAGLLRECGALSERALLAVSELEPERFELQLFLELERGTAREVQANGQVLLEAVG
ncbi:restriction endonuclease subunit S [Microcystis elabens FACHB-917]|nr:restriction endonuclease subunit S [Microcystis elabens FACHB-917]